MEITIPHSELTKALELVGRISTKHITLPVLQCVRMEAKGDTITLQATTLEISIEVPLPGKVEEEGVVAVPAQIFLQSIQFISQKEVTLRTEDQVLQLETSHTNTSIKTFSVDPDVDPLLPVSRYIPGSPLHLDQLLKHSTRGPKNVAH